MNFRKFSRLIGIPASHPGPMPDLQLMLDASMMARHNPFGGAPAGPSTITGQNAMIVVDPPVGNFASGDNIGQFPNLLSYDTWSAVPTIDSTRNFAPGVYDIGVCFDGTTTNTGINLNFYRAAPGGGLLPFGGTSPPLIGWNRRNANVAFWTCNRMSFDQKWLIVASTPTGLLDANMWSILFQCNPVHLYDDYPD